MGSVSQRAFAPEGRKKHLDFALYGCRSTAGRKESCVLSSAKVRIQFRIVEGFIRKVFRFSRMGRDGIKNSGLSCETPLLFSSSSPFFLKRRPFLRPPCHPLFPLPHLHTCERTRSCTSRTQRVRNSRLHPSPSPAIR